MALKAPDTSEKYWIASRIYAEVKYKFAHREYLRPTYRFDDTFEGYLRELDNAKTRYDFDKVTLKLFATLHNGHTSFYDELAGCHPNLAIKADFIQGKWIITDSKLPSLDVGSQILSINGEDFSAWADEQLPYIPGSSVRSQRRSLGLSRYYAWLWPIEFNLVTIKPGRSAKTFHINRTILSKEISEQSHHDPDLESRVKIQQMTPEIIRMTAASFEDTKNESIMLAALHRYRHARAILFDLRGNGGGITPTRLLLALAEQPFRDTISMTPQHIALNDGYVDSGIVEYGLFPDTWLRFGGQMIYPNPIYHGKVFILTDGGCASACEGFIVAMKSAHRATILGSATYGVFGASNKFNVTQSQMFFTIGTEETQLPDGSTLEGIGVNPDRAIPLTQEELLSGKDQVLRTTISYIKNTMQETHEGQ